MSRQWPYVALACAGAAAAAAWPMTPAIAPGDASTARLASIILTALACGALARSPAPGRLMALASSAVTALIGVALVLAYFDGQGRCIAEFEGRPVIIGTVYSHDAESYLRGNPGLSPADRLFDAGGVPARIWTAESIRTCRVLVSWGGVAAIPFLAASAATLLQLRQYTLRARPSAVPVPATVVGAPPIYDGFVSYRHVEPDRGLALQLVETLEGKGLRLAIDVRDFRPNEHFLSEMERCIKQSRFVLCVITPEYVRSDHTGEEAIISKTLDLAERRRRLVPLIFERVELPVWLHGLVGIDFTAAATVNPRDRLLQLLTADTSDTSSL